MKRKITLCIIIAISACMLFTGCDIKTFLPTDSSGSDPANITAANILGTTVKSAGNISGSFIYTEYTDSTVSITKYTGKEEVLTIPGEIDGKTVVAVDNKAVYANSSLKELILADSIKVLGNYSFMYCASLESVTFGKDIEYIGVSAFESEGDDANSTGKGSLKNLIFNGTPSVIDKNAFYFCDKLSAIDLPAGVKEIGAWAFAKCFNAEKIILRDGLEKIDDHAFLKCLNVIEITIPGTCKEISISAFFRCKSLTDLTLNDGIEKLDKGVFEECGALKSVIIPASVTEMDNYVFYNCTSLESVTYLGNEIILGDDIFSGDKNAVISAANSQTLRDYAEKNKLTLA